MNDARLQTLAINELQFMIAEKMHGPNIKQIFDTLMRSGLDENSLGFWVWDIINEVELYSPKFRASLQYSGEVDFPSVPQSWMYAIDPTSKELALLNFDNHVKSGGVESYVQSVTYNKKYKGKLKVLCHGKVVSWINDDPSIMIGVHLDPSGLYTTTVEKFKSKLDLDVSFNDILIFDIGVKTQLADGVDFTMQEKQTKVWRGVCVMKEGAELYIHHHSDYDEKFDLIEGEVIDLISMKVLRAGDKQVFLHGQSHYIYARKESKMKITGTRA